MNIENLKPDMIVFDAHSHRVGNTTMRTWGVWEVRIIEIDPEMRWVRASWNGNEPKRFYGRAITKWRKNRPVIVKSMPFIYRLQTPAEKRASKATR